MLVGGAALAMHIAHRLREDLDFAFNALSLPRERIHAVERAGLEAGFPFVVSGVPHKREIALSRLVSGRPHALDEGYEALLPNPPSLAEMAEFFREVADEAPVAAAARAMRKMGAA